MTNLAIQADGLGKRYRIGQRESYKTLRESITNSFAAPFRRGSSGQLPSANGRGTDDPRGEHIWALRDVSLDVKQGEAVGIIGRNGAGKSTLLKILSRITDPTEGRAKIHGRIGSLLEVGTGFHQELTGRENIYLNGAILGMKKKEIDRKMDEIVAFAEVEKFLDTPVKRYSSGMYVRLAFAVAAHMDLETLLVDEVLSVGDALFQKKCMGKMSQVAGQGRTVLFVSHNMAAVAGLTSRCVLLKDGKVEADGDTAAVVARYLEDSTSGNHGGVVDLNQAIKRSGSYPLDLYLTKLCLTNSEGTPQEHFYEGDPIHLTIDFEVRRPVSQFEIIVAVCTDTGFRLFTIGSGKHFWNATSGMYSVSTCINPNYLKRGFYNLNVGIQSSIWQDGGYDVAAFEIIDHPQGLSFDDDLRHNTGCFKLPYQWTHPAPAGYGG
jgi:lipopolysaccharide transport system ATP-binding protein